MNLVLYLKLLLADFNEKIIEANSELINLPNHYHVQVLNKRI